MSWVENLGGGIFGTEHWPIGGKELGTGDRTVVGDLDETQMWT